MRSPIRFGSVFFLLRTSPKWPNGFPLGLPRGKHTPQNSVPFASKKTDPLEIARMSSACVWLASKKTKPNNGAQRALTIQSQTPKNGAPKPPQTAPKPPAHGRAPTSCWRPSFAFRCMRSSASSSAAWVLAGTAPAPQTLVAVAAPKRVARDGVRARRSNYHCATLGGVEVTWLSLGHLLSESTGGKWGMTVEVTPLSPLFPFPFPRLYSRG